MKKLRMFVSTIFVAILTISGGSTAGLAQHSPSLAMAQDLNLERTPVKGLIDFGVLDEDQMRLVIETAYHTLERYTEASGSKLKLHLGRIKTFYPEHFDSIRWLNIVTMPDGRVVDTLRQTHHESSSIGGFKTASNTVTYVPKWRTLNADWLKAPWGPSIKGMSVAKFLGRAAADQPEMSQVRAITSYTITASLAGESRTYRAAFLWIATGKEQEMSFIVADNIVQNVDMAVREIVPLIQQNPSSSLRMVAPPRTKLTPASASCTPEAQSFQGSAQKTDAGDHLSGAHSSQASFEISCSCNSDCSQRCAGRLVSSTCEDTGWPSYCHRGATGSGSSTEYVSAGDRTPAQCSVGFGCVVKSCFGCSCGLSVSVSASGPNVTFTSFGSPDWDLSLPYSRTCPACQHPDPPPSGGSGGGGSTGGECTCDCDHNGLVTPTECVYDCNGTISGSYCYIS
jgi:hypothetical protein